MNSVTRYSYYPIRVRLAREGENREVVVLPTISPMMANPRYFTATIFITRSCPSTLNLTRYTPEEPGEKRT